VTSKNEHGVGGRGRISCLCRIAPDVAQKIDEDQLIQHCTLISDKSGQVAGKRKPTI